MRIIAINPEEVRDYVLEADKANPAEEQVTWRLGVIPHTVNNFIVSSCAKTTTKQNEDGKAEVGFTIDPVLLNSMRIKYGVKGWSNLRLADGKEVLAEFEEKDIPGYGKAMGLTDRALTMISPYMPELVVALRELLTLDGSSGAPESTTPAGAVVPAKPEGPHFP